MGTIASQITSLTISYSIVYSDADKKNQSSASLAFVNSPHKWPVTRKMFLFDDVIMAIPQPSPSFVATFYVTTDVLDANVWGQVTHICVINIDHHQFS